MSPALTRLAFPVWLAAVRVRHRAGRLALVVLGVAAATAMLAAIQAGTVIAQDRSVAERVRALPQASRVVRVNAFTDGGSEPYAVLDRTASRTLTLLLGRSPIATVLYRESTIAGRFMGLAAVDDLRRHVVLRAGRLPRRCRPARCEVLQLRGNEPPPAVAGLRLVRVGRGDLTSAALFGDAIPPTRNRLYAESLSEHYARASRYHQPPPPPLYLAEGVAGLSSSPLLSTRFRAYGWVVPIEPEAVRSWSARTLAADAERARSTLQAASPSFDLRAPIDELVAAATTSEVAGRRLFLLGGQAATLLLAFAALAAVRLRPETQATATRLAWIGASRWQLLTALIVEALLVAAIGTVLGVATGATAAAFVGARAGEDVGVLLTHSVFSPGGVATASVLAVAAALALAAATAIRPVVLGRRRLSPLDVAAAGAAVAVAVALTRGAADESALAREGGIGVFLLALPALAAFVGAVVTARLFGPALRLLERMAPERVLSFRLAALALARRPGYAAVAVAFVAVSGALALFAATYRDTLAVSQQQQAAFAVPADFVLSEDLSRLIPVADVATPPALARLGDDVRSYATIRQSGSVVGASAVSGITVLGVEPRLIPDLAGWRSDFAAAPPEEPARRIDAGRVRVTGAVLPPNVRRLVVRAAGRGTRFSLAAIVATPAGSFVDLPLRRVDARRPVLTARLPPEARGGRLVALRFDPPARVVERGADAGRAVEAVVTLAPVEAGDGRVVSDYAGWVGVGGARLLPGAKVRLRATLGEGTTTYFRPRPPPAVRRPLPVVASTRLAALAGDDGTLALEVAGESLAVRVVGVAERFPGTGGGDFAILARDLLVTALNVARPGAGFVNEVWLQAASEPVAARLERTLRRSPFDVLDVDSQRGYEAELKREPIGRAALVMLAVAALVAVGLALVGLLLGAVSEIRDERGELFDLEAQGVPPAGLRRQALLRTTIVFLFGLLGAAVTGLVLTSLVISLVALTAGATRPEPPLVLAFDAQLVAGVVATTAVAALALVAAAAATAFRGQEAGRGSEATT